MQHSAQSYAGKWRIVPIGIGMLLGEMSGVQVQLTVIAYSGAFSACSRDQRWQKALGLLGEICGAQAQPDVIT